MESSSLGLGSYCISTFFFRFKLFIDKLTMNPLNTNIWTYLWPLLLFAIFFYFTRFHVNFRDIFWYYDNNLQKIKINYGFTNMEYLSPIVPSNSGARNFFFFRVVVLIIFSKEKFRINPMKKYDGKNVMNIYCYTSTHIT